MYDVISNAYTKNTPSFPPCLLSPCILVTHTMILYLGLMSRDLNSIGNKDSSSSFFNVNNISEINHELEKDVSMINESDDYTDDVLHW